MADDDRTRQEAEAAAAEAAAIGGRPSSEPPSQEERDEAGRPVAEAGGGEAEGFEEAERELIEHATHGDQHAARRALEDAPGPGNSEDGRAAEGAEADEEHSSERTEDRR